MKILHFSSILPSPYKPRENDVLLVTADKHKQKRPNVQHSFVAVIPFASFLFAILSAKWSLLYNLRKKGKYEWGSIEISVVAMPMFKANTWIRSQLNIIGYYLNRSQLIRMVKQYNPDVLHAHSVNTEAYIAKRLSKEFGIPYVITVRGIQIFHHSTQVKDNLANAKSIICINYVQKSLVETLKVKQSFLLPHGIDESFFLSKKSSDERNRTPRIISICRLLELKNIDKVLLALENSTHDFVYHIYGEGPDQSRLLSILSQLKIRDKVKFMGHVEYSTVPNVLSQYDIFVMPSYPETLGRVYFEAMAAGLPVIGSKNTGIDGYIEEGVSGYLVNHHSIPEIADALEQLINNKELREEISKNSIRFASNFSWNKIIDNLDEIYTSKSH